MERHSVYVTNGQYLYRKSELSNAMEEFMDLANDQVALRKHMKVRSESLLSEYLDMRLG